MSQESKNHFHREIVGDSSDDDEEEMVPDDTTTKGSSELQINNDEIEDGDDDDLQFQLNEEEILLEFKSYSFLRPMSRRLGACLKSLRLKISRNKSKSNENPIRKKRQLDADIRKITKDDEGDPRQGKEKSLDVDETESVISAAVTTQESTLTTTTASTSLTDDSSSSSGQIKAKAMFCIGDIVEVAPRCWPGMNKQGYVISSSRRLFFTPN